jgi:hypothetical protein
MCTRLPFANYPIRETFAEAFRDTFDAVFGDTTIRIAFSA